jgi:hypothetical protein
MCRPGGDGWLKRKTTLMILWLLCVLVAVPLGTLQFLAVVWWTTWIGRQDRQGRP